MHLQMDKEWCRQSDLVKQPVVFLTLPGLDISQHQQIHTRHKHIHFTHNNTRHTTPEENVLSLVQKNKNNKY